MRSFSFLPSRLILVHPPLPPFPRPFTFPSHIILVSPQSHTLLPFRPTSSSSSPSHIPFYLSVPHHPRQPPVTYPFTFPSHIIPVSPSSHMPFYLFISFNISSHLCVFSPLVLDPRGKCRVFLRKRFTFPRGRPGHWLHRPLWPHLAFPPLGKVPGFPAKMVHFPPWPAGVPALQASLAALGISTSGESAGFSCENGSLSPAADKGTGSTGLSGRTCSLSLRGKCRVFLRKRFTFPRSL